MLRYQLKQFHLQNPPRFFLPIPKFAPGQLELLASDLERRGFATTRDGRLKVRGHGTRFTINPIGFASSAEDLLDSVIPSVAKLLAFPPIIDESNPYFAAKRTPDHVEVQFFPRMEALRIWTSLRREGECGLTPDEALVLDGLLRHSKREVECVTDYPTEGCTLMQIGRHLYFSSRVLPSEFLANLRTMTKRSTKNAYLPRSSLIQVDAGVKVGGVGMDLREWSYFVLPSQNL